MGSLKIFHYENSTVYIEQDEDGMFIGSIPAVKNFNDIQLSVEEYEKLRK
ncbi:hypothetical protein IPG41_01460 [Candidatus Peregrinibacteria bacterium]|nr:MAG: hypothetical protein IPG41_01460 [Candidatus Peregrinibacteria bacterium]